MDAVGRLYTDSWQRTYRGLIPDWVLDEMTPEKSRDKWTRYREQKENCLFVLERDGAVAGLVACRPFPERENSALLDSLHVAPEAQGSGWGRRLIARAARWARESGFQELVIFVVQGNRRAEQLYRGFGRVYRDLPPKWRVLVLTSCGDFEKCFGRKADKKRKLYNGMLKCDLYMFHRG